MIKIKLTERRTISASEELVDSISSFYKTNYLKLVEIYLKYKNNIKTKGIKDSGKDPKDVKGSDIYQIALDRLKSQYGDLLSVRSPISVNNFEKNISSGFSEKVIYKIASIPNENIVPHVMRQDTALKAFKSSGLNKKEASERIIDTLQSRGFKSINLFLEISSKEDDYAGIMDFDAMSISVNYNVDLFKKTIFSQRDMEQFFKIVETQIAKTKRHTYHEFQHLFADIVKGVTGFTTYGSPPRSTLIGDIPQDDPEEVQTYAQNVVTLFGEMVAQLSKNKSIKPKQLKNIKSIVLKKILNSPFSPEEQSAYDSLDKAIIEKYLKYIRDDLDLIKQYDLKIYNYALEILFSYVKSGDKSIDPLTIPLSKRYKRKIREDIIMNKIKIVLSENQLLIEEYTKDEIRKIVRDELEKMLRDKETRKEIAKITKEFVKKFYKELSINSNYVIDKIDT